MADGSYIKLHRKMTEWEWYGDINTKVLFLHMLLKANWKAKEWRGIVIKRGQFVSSYSKLSEETGLTIGEIRTALNHLKKTGEVAHEQFNKFGLFTVINYDKYQYSNSQEDSQLTVSQQSIDTLLATTNKEENDIKEKKSKNTYTQVFEEFWKVYPRKAEKARCFSCYKARVKEGYTDEQLSSAARSYANQCKNDGTEEKFIKHGSTFLSSYKSFEEYLPKVKEIQREEVPQEEIEEKPVDYGWDDQ